jgi:hypothetical protein
MQENRIQDGEVSLSRIVSKQPKLQMIKPGCFMNCCHESTKMGGPPGTRPAAPRDWSRGVPEWYVAGVNNRGRQEGCPYSWSQ